MGLPEQNIKCAHTPIATCITFISKTKGQMANKGSNTRYHKKCAHTPIANFYIKIRVKYQVP